MKNKKADSRLLTPWLFFVLGLIGVAIAVGVFSYFSGTADIRLIEARALADRVIFGISDGSYLKEGVVGGGFDILADSDIAFILSRSPKARGQVLF